MEAKKCKTLDALGLSYVGAAEMVTVTPEIAPLLMARNERNRVINTRSVGVLAGAIKRGEWEFNGDPIRFAPDGRLLDGQHRLTACVEAGKPIKVLLVVVPDKSQKTMDQGARRNFGNFLQMDGEKNASTIAAVVNLVWAWERDGVPSAQNRAEQATVAQKYDVLSRHPGIRDSVQRVPRVPHVTHTLAATMHYLFSMVDEDDADTFFRLLSSGVSLEDGHPIHTLRERLLRESMKHGQQIHTRVRTAFIIIAWNYWIRGEPLQRLTFRAGGSKPDKFPEIYRP